MRVLAVIDDPRVTEKMLHPRPAAGAPPLPLRPHFFSILLNSAVDTREPVR